MVKSPYICSICIFKWLNLLIVFEEVFVWRRIKKNQNNVNKKGAK